MIKVHYLVCKFPVFTKWLSFTERAGSFFEFYSVNVEKTLFEISK